MVRRSAEETLKALVGNEQYEAAIQFAEKSGLKAEEVYKIRWQRSDFGVSAIQENLPFVADKRWVLGECVRRVSPSIEGMSALISFGLAETEKFKNELHGGRESWFFICRRLRLLQYKDRLDTFLGIHMGRFSPEKYMIFRSTKLEKVARSFAEDGKTGVLELLLKRHAYTLAPSILNILEAIPETLSPHTYVQLLPDLSPPKVFLPRRAQDWCETESVTKWLADELEASSDDEVSIDECTEYMVKLSKGLQWPEEANIVAWYLQRARWIDQLSGQLENSLFLLDAGVKKGIKGLEALSKDVEDLCRISFSNAESKDDGVDLSLDAWEKLDEFEKFKLMLRGVTEDNIVDRLLEVAVPYAGERTSDFLARYLEEMSSSNLRLCAVVIEAACKRSLKGVLFKEEPDTVTAGLACIYGSRQTDQWELMASMLSKLLSEDEQEQKMEEPVNVSEKGIRRGLVNALRYRTPDTRFPRAPMDSSSNVRKKNPAISEELEMKLRVAEDYVQAGKLLFYYQVPTTIQSLVSAHEDVKGTKQMLRILLSKFSRKQPYKTDGEWATLWRDLHFLQEKVFTFLEKDYILFEFCRGLLKAGKFSLAKSYFKDSMSASEKMENLVIQTSREYFYSANSLESSDIDRARECLSLIPSSMAANAELDIIVAVTEKLPYLGVNLLPAQFRQLKDPMEVLKMAIEPYKGSSLPVEEVFEVARLLGFKSASETAVVEEALAREAAAYGDVLLAQDLCLSLAKKGHGKIWDLCVAIGRGSEDEKLDVKSRKELLGFALRHCDDESIGELLVAWKEFDVVDDHSHIPLIDTSELASTEALVDEDGEAETQYQDSIDSTGGSDTVKDDVDEPCRTETISENDADASSTTGNPRTVAEMSTEIIRNNFENGRFTEEDLRDIDTAFSCFGRLAENVASKQQATALKRLLEVWEPVFQPVEDSVQAGDEKDAEEEGWGDGWQDFDVAETSTVCQLHAFWKIACDKLIDNHGLQILLEVLDRRSSGSSTLLTEEEAKEVIDRMTPGDVFTAMKLSLLLPYDSIRSTSLKAVELELQRGATVPDSSMVALVISSGLVPSLAGTSLFSGIYRAVTELSRKSRTGLLLPEDSLGAPSLHVIIPYYISELTKGRHYGAAASLVLQQMRVPSAFATWNVSHFALKRYLEAQQSQLRQRRETFDFSRLRQSSVSYLCETIGRMVTSFDTVASEALSSLANDMK